MTNTILMENFDINLQKVFTSNDNVNYIIESSISMLHDNDVKLSKDDPDFFNTFNEIASAVFNVEKGRHIRRTNGNIHEISTIISNIVIKELVNYYKSQKVKLIDNTISFWIQNGYKLLDKPLDNVYSITIKEIYINNDNACINEDNNKIFYKAGEDYHKIILPIRDYNIINLILDLNRQAKDISFELSKNNGMIEINSKKNITFAWEHIETRNLLKILGKEEGNVETKKIRLRKARLIEISLFTVDSNGNTVMLYSKPFLIKDYENFITLNEEIPVNIGFELKDVYSKIECIDNNIDTVSDFFMNVDIKYKTFGK